VTDNREAETQTEGEEVEEQIGPPDRGAVPAPAVEEVEPTETPGELEKLC
jgi:hypothetical protein